MAANVRWFADSRFRQTLFIEGEINPSYTRGIDTYLDHALLAKLDTENRISSEGILDGFVPAIVYLLHLSVLTPFIP